MKFVVFFVIAAACLVAHVTAKHCKYSDYDFNRFDQYGALTVDHEDDTYYVTPCEKLVDSPSACEKSPVGQDAAACKSWTSGKDTEGEVIGSIKDISIVALPGNAEGGKIILSGGESCGNNGTYTTAINMNCNREKGGTPELVFEKAPSGQGCEYLFTVEHEFCCKVGRPATSPAKKKGLSGGSIILILALVFVVLYCGLGITWNVVKNNESGIAVIPQFEFWKSVPGLVLDGIKFTFNLVTGKGDVTTYNSI